MTCAGHTAAGSAPSGVRAGPPRLSGLVRSTVYRLLVRHRPIEPVPLADHTTLGYSR